VFYSNHVKTVINTKNILREGVILGSWVAGSFRTKSKFLGHYQLIDNANHRKKMRTCFRLCYNVNQKTYLQIFLGETCS